MRYSLILLLVLAQLAHGAWTVKEQTSLPSPGKTQFQRVEITNGTDHVRMNVVLFSAADCTLALMDDPEGAFDLASASRKRKLSVGAGESNSMLFNSKVRRRHEFRHHTRRMSVN